MIQSSMTSEKSRGGRRVAWRDDEKLVRQYIRIWGEVVEKKISVTIVASDYGYNRTHIYWIVDQVQRSGVIP